ncbi:GNAT family N-acetyltransferase [Chryseobacterium sp. T16E-39]|uniref:GNAT family N-acetyltransferase n=1 Tax=Chryseobacterium sp. T16E-39 TaxID=2015076 RepID=UPI000B5B31FE|nr:GNAT family N-acetyltransferase [Chryseobacterium sp. T16E-39]ASK29640.1 GNAT family N-acetyltransferase [Chryseobacterium sp. T16E-39]
MNIEYRSLLPHESRIYRTIRLESLKKFPESFGANYEEALQTEKFKLEYDIENQRNERFVIGAFSDGELIGICAFVKEEDNAGHIYQMYIKENFQGKNIGYGLIQAVVEEANNRSNSTEIVLEVTHSNIKAYQLYKKFGFKEVAKNTQEKETDSNIVMVYGRS